jgi:sugar phosphate isomerase/epimerase
MPLPLSIQLYSLRDRIGEVGLPRVLGELAAIGYAFVEFAGLGEHTARAARRMLDAEGLRASGIHAPAQEPAEWNAIEDQAKTLGCRHVVVGYCPPEHFASDDAARAIAEKVNAAALHFRARDLTVSYHNHDWEFAVSARAELFYARCPDAGLQIDIYWALSAGADPAELIARYARRTFLVHIKDGPADPLNRDAPMVPAGQGRVGIAACIRAAERACTEFLAVELDHAATDMLAAVRESYRYLIRHDLAKGQQARP